jgi:hypothetical protein
LRAVPHDAPFCIIASLDSENIFCFNIGMTADDLRTQNDNFRQSFKGGLVCMTPSFYQRFDKQLRGRAFARLARPMTFSDASDHSEGTFVLAGVELYWKIEMFAGHRTLTLGLITDIDFSLGSGHRAHFL